jgi:hypothetical protein
MHDPSEFVGAPCFEHHARDIDADRGAGGDSCPDGIDEHVRRTIRAHLVLQCGGDLIVNECEECCRLSEAMCKNLIPSQLSSTHMTHIRGQLSTTY